MSIEDIRAAARRSLHDFMGRAATYFVGGTVLAGVVYVRVGEKAVKTGDLAGTSLSYAEVHENRTRMIFDAEALADLGITLKRLDAVVRSTTEGYVIDTVLPRDGMTISCEVTRMSASELTGKATPEDVA
jgi:hypothetical protein